MAELSSQAELAERLRTQHREIKELLGQIATMLAERRASVEQVGERLARLGDLLVKHFTLEEHEGYAVDVLRDAPQLLHKANALLAQHPKMAARVQNLVSIGMPRVKPVDWWTQTRERFDAFVQELLEHERNEDRLLQQAECQDLGDND